MTRQILNRMRLLALVITLRFIAATRGFMPHLAVIVTEIVITVVMAMMLFAISDLVLVFFYGINLDILSSLLLKFLI